MQWIDIMAIVRVVGKANIRKVLLDPLLGGDREQTTRNWSDSWECRWESWKYRWQRGQAFGGLETAKQFAEFIVCAFLCHFSRCQIKTFRVTRLIVLQDTSGIYGEAMDDGLSRQLICTCWHWQVHANYERSSDKKQNWVWKLHEVPQCWWLKRQWYGSNSFSQPSTNHPRFLVSSQALSEQNLESLQIANWVWSTATVQNSMSSVERPQGPWYPSHFFLARTMKREGLVCSLGRFSVFKISCRFVMKTAPPHQEFLDYRRSCATGNVVNAKKTYQHKFRTETSKLTVKAFSARTLSDRDVANFWPLSANFSVLFFKSMWKDVFLRENADL